MFPVIRTTVAVSMIGLGLVALAMPAQAQGFRGKSIVASKAERGEGNSRFQRFNAPKAEREQSRQIEVVSRPSPRFNAPKAERFEPSRVSQQRFQAPKAERFEPSRVSQQRFQAPKAERFERDETEIRFAERPIVKHAKFSGAEQSFIRKQPKAIEVDAPGEEIIEEKPAKIVKKKLVKKSEPKVVHIDSSDDEYGYYDDYGYYTDAGYSGYGHGHGYNSCQ